MSLDFPLLPCGQNLPACLLAWLLPQGARHLNTACPLFRGYCSKILDVGAGCPASCQSSWVGAQGVGGGRAGPPDHPSAAQPLLVLASVQQGVLTCCSAGAAAHTCGSFRFLLMLLPEALSRLSLTTQPFALRTVR